MDECRTIDDANYTHTSSVYIVNDKALNMNSCILIIYIFLAKETFDTNNTPIIYTLRIY